MGPGGPDVRRLGRYVPRWAAEWDLDVPDQSWQVVDATLCLVDLAGFTALSERLARRGRIGAEELTGVLDRIFGDMLVAAWERGGTLLKFGGDALLIGFTSPSHAVEAACAAVEMRSALRRASPAATTVGRIALGMTCGIHSGPVHLFRVGASHLELLVCGPGATQTVDTESLASNGEIVVSATTAALLPAGSTTDRGGRGHALRWRRAPSPPSGHVEVRAITGEQVVRCVPLALRQHLGVGAVDAEHRLATVAFVRCSGIDLMLNRDGAPATSVVLQRVVEHVQHALDEEDVTFLGTDVDRDGAKIVLVAGAPVGRVDDDGRVLRAMRKLADRDVGLPLNIGVARGHVFAGEVGTTHRATYTVIGDTVNVAARLMTAAPAGAVYATPAVLDGARTLFAVTSLEPLGLKGKSNPVVAYAVGATIGDRRGVSDDDLPFTGRSDVVRLLLSAVSAARSGTGSTVEISGDAGTGKSRLVHEVVDRARLPMVEVRGEPYGTATPYRAFRDAIRSLTGLDLTAVDRADVDRADADRAGVDRGDRHRSAKLFASAIERADPSLVPWIPLIASVVHVDVEPTAEVRDLDPRHVPSRTAEVTVRLLAALLPGPALVVVDDAHWLDPASVALVRSIAVAAPDERWVVIVATRQPDAELAVSAGSTIDLEPLPADDAATIVDLVTAAAPLHRHVAGDVVERSGGNPLFLRELLRVVRSGSPDDLPETLEAVVRSEIDRLPPLARRVLGLASVLGRSFRVAQFDDVITADGVTTDRATTDVLDRYIEPDGAGQLRFRHALFRDVLYDGLTFRRRRELHHRVASSIIDAADRDVDGDVDAVAGLLALHYERALVHDLAWRYAQIAGDQARNAYAHPEAAVQDERCLRAARYLPVSDNDRARVLMRLGDAREHSGSFHEAFDAYRRASQLVGSDQVLEIELRLRRARVRERACSFRAALGELTKADHLIDAIERSGETSGTEWRREAGRLRARTVSLRAVIRQGQQRPHDARIEALRAARLAERVDDRFSLARALTVLDWSRQLLMDSDEGDTLTRALHLYEQVGDLEGQANVIGSMGIWAYYDGRWDEAVELYRRGSDLFERAGNQFLAAIGRANIGEIRVNQGRLDEAEIELTDAARVMRAAKYADGSKFAEIQLARSLAARGDLADAELLLRKAFDDLRALGQHVSALEAAAHLAVCLARSGRAAAALELLDEAEDKIGDDGGPFAITAAYGRATALATIGRQEDAARLTDDAIDGARTHGVPFELAQLLLLRSTLTPVAPRRTPDSDVAEATSILESLGVRRP